MTDTTPRYIDPIVDITTAFVQQLTIASDSFATCEVHVTRLGPQTVNALPAIVFSLDGNAICNELGFCGYVRLDDESTDMVTNVHPVRGYRYEGGATLEIMAMSSLTKDRVKGQVVSMLQSDKTLSAALSEEGIMLLKSSLNLGGERSSGFDDGSMDVLYTDSVSFKIIAEVFYDDESMLKVESFRIVQYFAGKPDPEPDW